jgi:hypothetical protein
VVFLSFWQSVTIDLLFTFGVISYKDGWTTYEVL